MTSLYDRLLKLKAQGNLPMHMPGHKRNTILLKEPFPFDLDITEIKGFDNLHNPSGILLEGQERAARLYGAKESFYVINGSSAGVLASLWAATQHGDEILMGRHSHKSVYNGVELMGLKPHYLLPTKNLEWDIAESITPDSVAKALDAHPEVSCVLITSPTYEGVVSPVEEIAAVVHAKGIPLIVDAAHGAHFGFSEGFPNNPVTCGADLVINSLHKTLPALTQTGLVHVSGDLVDPKRLERGLSIFQTTSPSYLLMASIDSCLRWLENEGPAAFKAYEKALEIFSQKVEGLLRLRILDYGDHRNKKMEGIWALDRGKLLISTKGTSLSGSDLDARLIEQYAIELEMPGVTYAVGLTSVADTEASLGALADALIDVDRHLEEMIDKGGDEVDYSLPDQLVSPSEAVRERGEPMVLGEAAGHMALEAMWAYPPGIPIILPGEQIDEGFIAYVSALEETGIGFTTTTGDYEGKLKVK